MTDPEGTAAPPRRKVDTNELRVPRYEGPAERLPIHVMRARALVGTGVLERFDDGGASTPLPLPEGKAGEAEELLGRANPRAAIAAVEDPSVDEIVRLDVKARAALMSGDVPGARALLGKADDSRLALADAMVSLAEGRLDRAQERLAQFQRPGIAERYAHALLKVAEGAIHDAQDALIEVARSASWHAVARYQLGQLLLATGDPARAGTLFEMAAIIAPEFIAPSLTLAEMLADSRQYGEALGLVQQITERAPDANAPRVLQLRILLEIGERDAALVLAQALRERTPDDLEVALLYAEALIEGEQRQEAITILDDVMKRQGASATTRQRAHRLRARLALSERPARAEDALALLKAAAALDGPLTGELALELFQVAWALGKKQEAEAALDVVDGTDDASQLISGAILARSHALWGHARKLGEKARAHVMGTPAEAQLDAFLQGLP